MATLEELTDRTKGKRAIEAGTPTTDAEEREQSRLSQRAAVRRRIAEFQLRDEKVREIRRVIDSINAKSDEAANEHAAKCEPLQRELGELHERQLEEIVNKAEPNQADAARRQGLLQLVADANAELEKVVQANKAAAKKIEKQIGELLRPDLYANENVTTLQNKLCNQLATEQQQDRAWLLQQKIRSASARVSAAGKVIEDIQQSIHIIMHPEQWRGARGDRSALPELQKRLRRWKLEKSDANLVMETAVQESDELRRECLDAD